jgi:UDP-N-acetylglucosamine diphosphorylase/glucosamine-1-phosphate N-acetyltransferase
MAKDPIILLVEDGAQDHLWPVASTRPMFELRSGALNLRERAEMVASGRVRAYVRRDLRALLSLSLPELLEPIDEDARVLVLNARLRISVEELRALYEDVASHDQLFLASFEAKSQWGAAWLSAAAARRCAEGDTGSLAALQSNPSSLVLFSHPWDLIAANEKDLRRDFASIARKGAVPRRIFGVVFEDGAPAIELLRHRGFGDSSTAILYPGVHILAESEVLFGPGAKVKPGVVLDAESGPILIGAGAVIEANVTVQGPAYLGPGSHLHPMTRLREGSSVGALCKLGGELEEAVILDLSNKQHDGFLGHAYLGSWVNLGADTNASDLKNNYGSVRVDLGSGEIDTKQRFLGPILGDHVRCGINTMFNTGTVVGVCVNLFGAGFPPRHVESFRWGGSAGLVDYELEKALATLRTVLSRRKVEWKPAYEELMRTLHATRRPVRGMRES